MVEKHRLWTLALSFLVVSLSSFGLLSLKITSDNRSFFGPEDSHFETLTQFEEQFSPYSTAVFLITSSLPISYSTPHKVAHAHLTRIVNTLPHIARVDSLATFPVVSTIDDEITVETLLDEHCSEDECVFHGDALGRKILKNRFINKQGTTSAVVGSFRLKIGQSSQVQDVMDSISSSVRLEFETTYPDLELHITGGVPMMQAFVSATEVDLGTLIPLAGILLLTVLIFVLGSAYLATAMIVLGAAASAVSLGIAGWFGLVLNSATSSIPIVIFALTIASTMHLFLHLARGYAIHGSTTLQSAFRSAILIHAVPMILTIGTTVIGMLSLINVPSPPVKELGIWVSLGLVAGCILTFTALPAALSYRQNIPESQFAVWLQKYFNSYAKWIESGRSQIVAFVFLFLLTVAGVSQLRVDDDFVAYFDANTQFRADTDFATDKLTGPYGVEIVLSNRDGEDIFNPTFFEYLSKIDSYLSEDRRVRSVVSIYDILADVKDDIQPTNLPLESETTEYLSQLFLAYDFSLRKDQSTSDFVDVSQKLTRISVILDRSTSTEIREFIRDIESWHQTNGGRNISLVITGESVPTAFLSPTNIESMLIGIVFSLAFSAGILGLYYKSAKIGLIALVSILIPILMGFGIWGWIFGSIGLATTVVIAITIGVVIDDSIHLIVRAVDGHENLDLDGDGAAAYAIYRVGVAIVGTTLVLAGAFSVLLASGFQLNSAFGACTALVLICALAFDLIALPKMISWSMHVKAPNN